MIEVKHGTIPKRRWKYELVQILKSEGVFLSKLFERCSILWG